MKNNKFKLCLVLHVKGRSTIPKHLQLQIETFVTDTVVPLLASLKNEAEELEISLGVIDCDDADDVVIHKCLSRVKFINEKQL